MSEETLALFIRRHRKEASLTQLDLAEAIQMTSKSVTNWESGREIPSRDALARMAALFKIQFDEFRRFISDDAIETLSADQVQRKQQAIRIIDELLSDPRKLDQWIDYGEWLRSRGSDENP